MVRYHRMRGFRTVWIPGTDHAAIATQSRVEDALYKKEGKTRHDLGRDVFLKRVEEFAQEHHNTIVNQVKKMRNMCIAPCDAGIIAHGGRLVNQRLGCGSDWSGRENRRCAKKSVGTFVK